MSNRPRRTDREPQRPVSRGQQALQQREANVQRRVALGIAGAVLLALLIIAAGVIYEQILVPGRTIKRVDGQTLNRSQYDQIAREATLQQIAQNVYFSKLVGPNASFGQEQGGSFAQQVVQGNQQLAELGTIRGRRQPVTDQTVNQWVDAQLVQQGAQAQFKFDPSQGEVDQLIVARLGSLLATPEAMTPTTELTATAGISGTAEATAEPAATSAATATAAASPTSGPTSTPAASPTPSPSPLPEEATNKAGQIFKAIYDEYTAILNDLPREADPALRTPHATQEDFAAALRSQYRDELIRTRVKEQLVTEVNPEETAEPEQIRARHILLKVPRPEPSPTPTELPEGTATAESTATTEATATVEPTPTQPPTATPTLEPTALEARFAERKQEADAIYEQVRSNPESFPDVARARSEDEGSAARGGELDPFGRGQMVQPFEEAAFALKENEISQPIRSEFGWHIIQRLPEDPTAKLERQRQAAFDAWLNDLRQSATIVPAPTATPTQPPAPTTIQTETAPEPGATEVSPAGTAVLPSPEETPEGTPEATTATP